MPIIKCQKCGYEGEGPSDEFCHLCGTELKVATEHKGPQPPPPPPPPPLTSNPPLSRAVKAKLVITKIGHGGHEFPIAKDEVVIGRLDPDGGIWPDIDLTQDDPDVHVSRRHARISFKDGKYFIEDLGSVNGTFVNKGLRLAPSVPQELKNGDEIVVGRTFLSFLIQ